MKKTWNLVIFQMEILAVHVVVARNCVLSVNLTAGDEHRFAADAAQFVQEFACLIPGDTLHLDGCACQITGFGIVREGQIGDSYHIAHQFYLPFCHTVIEPSTVAEDGIYKYRCSLCALFLAVACYQFCLLVAEHQSSADSVNREAKFFPYWQRAADIVRRVLDVEFPIVERVRHECCRQAIGGNTKVRQDGQHRYHTYLTVAHDIIYQ